MSEAVLLFAILFGAGLIQSVTGFGAPLVAVPLLALLFSVQVATPLFAITGMLLQIVVLWYYRESFRPRAVLRLMVGAAIGVPPGVWALGVVPERVVLAVLGAILIGYALYALITPRLPQLKWPGWGYFFGFVSGCLGGAYSSAGPPVILYGNMRGWSREEFKSNLQAYFLFVSVVIIIGHLVVGNLNNAVFARLPVALLAILLGTVLGLYLDRFIEPTLFKKLVLVLLIILGITLLI